MSGYSYHHGDELGSDLGSGAMIGIGLLLLAIFLVWKAIALVSRVFMKYPSNKVLWVSVGVIVFFGLLALKTREPVALILGGLSVIMLVLVARLVELYYDSNFQLDRGPLLTQCLRGSSWKVLT